MRATDRANSADATARDAARTSGPGSPRNSPSVTHSGSHVVGRCGWLSRPLLLLSALPCAMKLARLGGIDLEYAVEGVGEPVVLVHAGAVADFFAPLVGPLARSGRFRVVHYHR